MGVAWDPATKRADAVLSNGNLTVSTADDGSGQTTTRGTVSEGTTGKRVLAMVLGFNSAPDEELIVGIAQSAWDWSASGAYPGGGASGDSIGYAAAGKLFIDGNVVAADLPACTNGQEVKFLVDFAGSLVIRTPAGDSDPISIAASAAWYPGYWGYSDGGPIDPSATIVPDRTDGDYAVWNSTTEEGDDMANDTVTDYTEDGEIPAAAGVAELAQDAPGSYTIAAPDPEAAAAIGLEIFSSSNYQQVVSGAFNNSGAVGRISFAKGGMCRLRAIDGAWYIQSANRGVTIG